MMYIVVSRSASSLKRTVILKDKHTVMLKDKYMVDKVASLAGLQGDFNGFDSG